MTSFTQQSLFALAITVFVVYRFARRELRERTVKGSTLWIRPAIIWVLTVYLVYLSATKDPLGDAELITVMLGSAILGAIVGIAIVRNTHFSAAAIPGAVRVVGNRITFGIWIAALAVRLVARFVLPHGADPRAQLPLNSGLVVMTAIAFTVIASAFYFEIARYKSVSGSPSAIDPGVTTRQ